MPAPTDTPHGLLRLGDDPAMLAQVRVMVKVAIAAGEFPGRRGMPEEHQAIVWFGRANAPLAFATFADADLGRVWLDIVYVRPVHRRKGYGTALVAAVERLARERGDFEQIVFGTALDNFAMRALAARLGYAERYIDLVKELRP